MSEQKRNNLHQLCIFTKWISIVVTIVFVVNLIYSLFYGDNNSILISCIIVIPVTITIYSHFLLCMKNQKV